MVSYNLRIIRVGKPLFSAIRVMSCNSCFLFASVMDKLLAVFIRYLQAAISCSIGWFDMWCMVVYVLVRFLYISIVMWSVCLLIVRSRQLISPFNSSVCLNSSFKTTNERV